MIPGTTFAHCTKTDNYLTLYRSTSARGDLSNNPDLRPAIDPTRSYTALDAALQPVFSAIWLKCESNL